MVLTVEDMPHALLELLWIREAWRLDPADSGGLPPRLVDPPDTVAAAERAAAPVEEWAAAWPRMWHECLRHAAAPAGPASHEGLHALSSADRARAVSQLRGPAWADRFGSAALDGSREWQRRAFDRHIASMQERRGSPPERAALDALVPAWRLGLTQIVQIPCLGTFTHKVGSHGLLVTAETRADSDRYREALTLFR